LSQTLRSLGRAFDLHLPAYPGETEEDHGKSGYDWPYSQRSSGQTRLRSGRLPGKEQVRGDGAEMEGVPKTINFARSSDRRK
ncbi:MAG: hypothetical protein LUC43_09735, partial [Burkholderiales bacterium]|nr:hypothetical protein [Burkholderiales bacterium]